jgi:hypothetical protein
MPFNLFNSTLITFLSDTHDNEKLELLNWHINISTQQETNTEFFTSLNQLSL